MSLLDDFDKIVANQTQDPEYQKRLEMARWLEKYPGDGGILLRNRKRKGVYP